MTDILIREVDDAIAERLRQVAVERNWPVNQVILHALRVALGLDPDYVEATGFAWLARARIAMTPGNLPAVTGARGSRVLGAIHGAPDPATP